MKPKWLIEHFDERNGTHNLVAEVEKQGYELALIEYTPIQQGSIDVFSPDDCVITQTSISIALDIMKAKKWVPGPWVTSKNYECSSYYAHLGKYLFNDPYVIMPRNDVPRHLNQLHKWIGKDDKLFMRPNSGLKPFTAQVFNLGLNDQSYLFDADWGWVKEFTDPETLIVIAGPKVIQGEWRFIVAGKEVITGSQYQLKDNDLKTAPEYPQEAWDLAVEVACTYQPDPMFVVDICLGEDNKYYLMEIGAFSIAGLYSCNMEKIVQAAVKVAEQEWTDLHG